MSLHDDLTRVIEDARDRSRKDFNVVKESYGQYLARAILASDVIAQVRAEGRERSDPAWVVYDHDYGPYAISLHRTAEEAAMSAARAGYGRVAKWEFGDEFEDAIREWERHSRDPEARG